MEIDTANMHQNITVPETNPSSSRRATVEEVEDEEITRRSESPTPSELSRLEEDGLGDQEEIFATVNANVQASCASRPSPACPTVSTSSLHSTRPSVRFGPPIFSHAEETFQHTPVISPGPPGAPPPPEVINEAINKLHAILRPSWGPNTKG
ncbi:hypothetical protein C8R44DRAFT_881035 [Mycena epipterygia]|nr:hypothetical protein C8R44DRAFT_881035 [Mycena epipterygia]